MDTQTRYAVIDTRTEDEPACPTWVLAGDDPLASGAVRAYAAAALATGEVDGAYIEQAYDRAQAMDDWYAQHGPGPGAPPPIPAAVYTGDVMEAEIVEDTDAEEGL